MADDKMAAQMGGNGGFIAALDQSGGSTPETLRLYGIQDSAYSGEIELYKLVHEMRVRIMSAAAFTGDKVIGTILFERTMDGEVEGRSVPAFLWEARGVVPFVKIDKGLEAETDGVCMMKPIAGLDSLLERAAALAGCGKKAFQNGFDTIQCGL
jgi:fructose-bisphosphate aldolase class I